MYIRVKRMGDEYSVEWLKDKAEVVNHKSYRTRQAAVYARDKAFIDSLFRAGGTLNVIKGIS